MGFLFTNLDQNFIAYRAGFSLSHINRPSQEGFLINSSKEMLYIRYDLLGGARIPLYEWTLKPDFLFSSLGPAKEFISIFMFELPKQNNNLSNSFGFGTRIVGSYRIPVLNDALCFYYQLYYENFDFGFSYDYNLSSLRNATSTYGAFETSIIYYFQKNNSIKSIPKKYKKGKTDCPKHLKPKYGWANKI